MYGMIREQPYDTSELFRLPGGQFEPGENSDDADDAETDTDTSDTDTDEMERNEWAQILNIRAAVKNNNLDAVERILNDQGSLALSDLTEFDETLPNLTEFDETLLHTALHTAAEEGHDAIVDLLIKKGANVNALTDFGKETPLHLAITKASSIANVIYLLISNGANINVEDNVNITPLDGLKDLKTIMALVEYYVRMQNKRPGSDDTPTSKRRRTSLRF